MLCKYWLICLDLAPAPYADGKCISICQYNLLIPIRLSLSWIGVEYWQCISGLIRSHSCDQTASHFHHCSLLPKFWCLPPDFYSYPLVVVFVIRTSALAALTPHNGCPLAFLLCHSALFADLSILLFICWGTSTVSHHLGSQKLCSNLLTWLCQTPVTLCLHHLQQVSLPKFAFSVWHLQPLETLHCLNLFIVFSPLVFAPLSSFFNCFFDHPFFLAIPSIHRIAQKHWDLQENALKVCCPLGYSVFCNWQHQSWPLWRLWNLCNCWQCTYMGWWCASWSFFI